MILGGHLTSKKRICPEGAVNQDGSVVWPKLAVSATVVRRHVHDGTRSLIVEPSRDIFFVDVWETNQFAEKIECVNVAENGGQIGLFR
ncbi:hypothetical protein D9613_012658 [Agrocybe pediades]|uniref:Uncharacterized protein n=1 Tax=Agrocybe pediades TaxID=84607 RepID=A0A8H4QWH2_9AGAR|nr:hypothetical protein D9613_012658 [Agrocybe pediades]